jgi:hypothetical protein
MLSRTASCHVVSGCRMRRQALCAIVTVMCGTVICGAVFVHAAEGPAPTPVFESIPVPASGLPGVPVAYLPAATKAYLGSASVVAISSSEYVVSHDVFGPGSTRDRTYVYGSLDGGRTWSRRAEIGGQWWSGLFVHKQRLYLMGTSAEYGHCVIRRSTDGGRTWTNPVDSKTGLLLGDGKYHTAPVPVVVHGGRVWRAMEDAQGPGGWGHHFRALMMSAPVDSDLLDAESWTVSNRLERNPDWLGGKFHGWLEGNAVVTREGRLVNVLRVDNKAFPEVAAIVGVSADGREIAFNPVRDFVRFPGGSKKFSIRWDERTKLYVTLANFVPPEFREGNPASRRNTLALMTSPELREWTVRQVLIEHPDTERHGFQYVDWQFDGEDLIAAIRTAHHDGTSDAHNAHDSNYVLFRRFADWRRSAGLVAGLPSGDLEIAGGTGADRIVIRTTNRLAGAVDSLTWNGREFIDSVDHGRQLQSASNLDFGSPIKAETFNPTEAGSRRDGAGPRSSSRLLQAFSRGNTLQTTSQMAFWLSPDEFSDENPAKNRSILSNHLLTKRLTIGQPELPRVVRADITFSLPAGERHTHAVFEALTGYMPAEFTVFRTFSPETGLLEPLDDGPGEQRLPVVFATESGSHAMGIWGAPESPGTRSGGAWTGPSYGRFRFTPQKVVKWNCVYRLTKPEGIEAGEHAFRMFVAVGEVEEVRKSLVELARRGR